MGEPLELIDPEEARRQLALGRAADVLRELPGDRQARVALLGARLDLFAPAVLQVRTKDGGPLWPFVLNPIQMRYLDHLRTYYRRLPGVDAFRGIRDLIVKPRQLGFSTFIAALFFMDGYLSPGRISVVLTHDRNLSVELLRTYKTLFENLPDKLKEAVDEKAASKYELEYEFHHGSRNDPPSRFVIATEGGNPWRGGTIHNLHASEAAHYRDWSAFKASFVNAVPKSGNIAYETTVNGFNEYYDAVDASLHGRSTDRVVFFPWFDHPEYFLDWSELPLQMQSDPFTEDELRLMAPKSEGGHELTREQIAWRRAKRADSKLFDQEFPETLLGAFMHSGRPFFDLGAVKVAHEASLALPAPREPRTGVQVWEDPIPGELYLVSADVAEGKDRGGGNGSDPEHGGTDFSRAYVHHVASRLRVVAAVGGRIRPVEFARMLDKVGRAYEACIAVERNNHGHTVLATLEASGYPEVYRHREYNEGGTKAFLAPGFPTTTTTRGMILDALDEVIRRPGAYSNPDPRFWLECNSFHLNETGKAEAISGKHDDRVMAGAIGAYLCTLGRGGWNAGLADGSDSAGFPRVRPVLAPPPAPVVPPAAKDPEPMVSMVISAPELSEAILALGGTRRDEEDRARCASCLHREGKSCTLHGCMVDPNDPACEAHIPDDEDMGDQTTFGEEGEEQWTL